MPTTFLTVANNIHWRVKTTDALNNTTDPITFDLEDGTGDAGGFGPTGNCLLTVWDDGTYPDDPWADPNMEVLLLPAQDTTHGRHTDQLRLCVRAQTGSRNATSHMHSGTPRVGVLMLAVHLTQYGDAINAIEATLPSFLTSSAAAAAYQPLDADLTAIGGLSGLAKGSILVYNGTAWTKLPVGTNGKAIVADSTQATGLNYSTVSGGGGPSTQTTAQTAHGLSVGNWIKCTGTNTFAKVVAASASYGEVIGQVASVVDANNFTWNPVGNIISGTGWTAGLVYWLDPTTAGAATSTLPETLGTVRKALFIAFNSTTAVQLNFPGMVVPVGLGGGGAGTGGGGGGGSSTFDGARVTSSVDLTIPTGTFTDLIFDTEAQDTGTYWASGSPSLLTVPSNGTYEVRGHVYPKFLGGTLGRLEIMRVSDSAILGAAQMNAATAVPTAGSPIPNLLGYWAMDEASGATVIDSSGNGFNGTQQSPVTIVSGHVGSHARDIRSHAYIDFGNITAMNAATALSYSFWLYCFGGTGDWQGLVCKPGGDYELLISSSLQIAFYGNLGSITTPGAITANVWNHIAFCWDQTSGSAVIYVNGTSAVSNSGWTGTMSSNSNALTVGVDNSYPRYGNFYIDDLAVFLRKLTSTEVNSLKNSPHSADGAGNMTFSVAGLQTGQTLTVATRRALLTGDAVKLRYYQNRTANETLQSLGDYTPEFSIQRLGD